MFIGGFRMLQLGGKLDLMVGRGVMSRPLGGQAFKVAELGLQLAR